MSDAKLNIAIAGLGRMGARHALHFYNLTPRANLIAASSPDKKERVWADRNLEGVRTYESYDEMLRAEKQNGLQAVVIASATTVHAEQAIKAIEMGLHVLCEKPLSTSVEIVSGALPATPPFHALLLMVALLAVTIRLHCVSEFYENQP
jgi:myo-inositol 2-dehydrogenase/D-chiro-inositol 1-dehydrogenase